MQSAATPEPPSVTADGRPLRTARKLAGPAVTPASGPRGPAAAKAVAAVSAPTGGRRRGPSERAARTAREASRPSPAAPDARHPDGDDRTERRDPVPARAVA